MTQVFLLLFSHRRNLIYIEREMKKKIRGDWREMVRVRLLVRWFLAGKRRRWREREETWGGFPAVVLAVGGVGKEDATVGFGYPSGPRTNLRVFFFQWNIFSTSWINCERYASDHLPLFFLLCLEYFPRRELIARDICALHFRGCFSRLSDHALCIRTRMVLEHSKYTGFLGLIFFFLWWSWGYSIQKKTFKMIGG